MSGELEGGFRAVKRQPLIAGAAATKASTKTMFFKLPSAVKTSSAVSSSNIPAKK